MKKSGRPKVKRQKAGRGVRKAPIVWSRLTLENGTTIDVWVSVPPNDGSPEAGEALLADVVQVLLGTLK